MLRRLATRLDTVRHQQFVGRSSELALFQSALALPDPPFHVLYVFGPGGVGKTSLLREFIRSCEQQRRPAYYLDAHNIESAPEAFLTALRSAMGISPSDSPVQALALEPQNHAILVDTYEALVPLDSWLRDVFLPQLPENIMIVLASRNPPAAGWQADPGWQTLIRTLPLRNLSPEESRDYLSKRAVPAEQYQKILGFTHGHALALSLVADLFAQRGNIQFEPEAAPDIVQTLLEEFVQIVPGPAHRAALEACALVRVTTEALLVHMLSQQDSAALSMDPASMQGVHELFEWLRGLSFIEFGPEGLFPHDLAGETLVADLRWRNPDWYAELHRRARNYYAARLQQTHGLEQHRVLFDYVFLHRDNPAVRPMFEWQSSGGILPDVLRDADRETLIAMVAQFEGAESAKFAECWLSWQPEAVTVYRDDKGVPIGFIAFIALNRASPEQLHSDPATFRAWEYLQASAPLRHGEVAAHYRFWMARDTYQAVSPVQTLIFLNTVRYQLTTPGLAYHFFPCADAEFWAPMFAYANLRRLSELDYEVGGKHYGVYAHDWRTEPPLAWLQLLAEREISSAPVTPLPMPGVTIIVLSELEFAEAVQEALRGFARVGGLRDNPLLRSRLVLGRVGAASTEAEREATLRASLKEAVESLQSSPRDAKLYRALYHTFLKPEPTQEQAAEKLDLPFSTYRRHLKAGVTREVQILWRRELGSTEK